MNCVVFYSQAINSDKPYGTVDRLGMEAKMAELLTPQALYNQDILLWVEDTIAKLKAHDFANLDLDNLIEEIDTLGKSQRNAMRSLLRRLIEHLLKRCYVPLPECYVLHSAGLLGKKNIYHKRVRVPKILFSIVNFLLRANVN